MTPERTAELVLRWVRLYTRNIPTPIARRRVDEIHADLHDHIVHERTHGTSDRRIALSIVSRMVRGLAADASWRGALPATPEHTVKHPTASRTTIGIAIAAAFLLLLPALAMQVSDEVAWGPGDFAAAGALLAGAVAVRELVARQARTPAYNVAAGVALGAALLLVWAFLAVGIVGEPGDATDLLYGGVLAVGVLGAVIARFRPEGMAHALVATAGAQVLVGGIALVAGKHEAPLSSVTEIVAVNAFFAALFLASAWLFRHAAQAPPVDAEPVSG